MSRNRVAALGVGIVIAFAALIRVAYFATLTGHPEFRTPMLDAGWFHEQGARVAAGTWGGAESVFRAPLYPLLLGALYRVTGPDPASARLVQLLLGALTVALVMRLSRKLYGETAGLLAGVLAAFYWVAIYFEGEILIASILPLLGAAILLALLRADESGRPRDGLLAGFTLGLFAIARPNILLFAAVAALWLGRRGRSRAALLLAGMLLLVVPVTVRNRVVTGEWIPIASQGGLNFYIGNHRGADGRHAIFPGLASWRNDDIERLTAARLGHLATPNEISRYWSRMAVREIVGDPVAFAGGLARKAYYLAQDYEIGNNRDLTLFRRENRILSLPLVSAGVLFPLALVGLVTVRARRRGRSLLIAYLAAYAFSVILFFVCARFRVPLLPALFPPAGAGLAGVAGAVRRRESRGAFVLPAAVALLSALLTVDPLHIRVAAEGQEAFHRGNVLAKQGRADEAIDAYREATQRVSRFPGAHFHLGVVLLGEGRGGEGEKELETALSLDPTNPRIAVTLAGRYAATGRASEAEALYRKSLEEDPFFPDTYVNFGGFLAERGRAEEAEPLLRRGLELAEDDPAALVNLGKLLAEAGRESEAVDVLLRCTTAAPGRADGWFELGNALFRAGRSDDAAGAYRRAAGLDPRDIRSRLNLSLALARAGDLPGAGIALREVLAIDPSNETARKRLSEMGGSP